MYLKNRAFYRVEYEFVPALMNAYKKYGKLSLFNDVNVWKKNIQSWGPSIYDNFDWDALHIKTYGKEGDPVIVVLYVFPEPFRSPQAAYGAIVIENDKVNYYTDENPLSKEEAERMLYDELVYFENVVRNFAKKYNHKKEI